MFIAAVLHPFLDHHVRQIFYLLIAFYCCSHVVCAATAHLSLTLVTGATKCPLLSPAVLCQSSPAEFTSTDKRIFTGLTDVNGCLLEGSPLYNEDLDGHAIFSAKLKSPAGGFER